MNKTDEKLLDNILDKNVYDADAYSIRKNGESVEIKVNENIRIVPKENKRGIDIFVKENTPFGIINIPVIITESGLKDIVYNDFYIGSCANVIIIAGCGIHNTEHKLSEHDGIHSFHIANNAKVKYIEKHFGEGTGAKAINPITKIYLGENASMEMETIQIKGVDNAVRKTFATLKAKSNLNVTEKILTDETQIAKTVFDVKLKGEEAKAKIVSRAVATEASYQEFKSSITGDKACFAHVECDAILMNDAKVKAIPKIYAKNIDARLIHEASIGKIAGEQLVKLMSLGLDEKQAENTIVKGFLN